MHNSGASRRGVAKLFPIVIVREGGRSGIPETSVIKQRGCGVLDTPHARGMTVMGLARNDALMLRVKTAC